MFQNILALLFILKLINCDFNNFFIFLNSLKITDWLTYLLVSLNCTGEHGWLTTVIIRVQCATFCTKNTN